MTDFDSFGEIEKHFSDKWREIQQQGNTDKCLVCENMESGVCAGGCLSRTFTKLDFLKTS